MSLAFLDCFSGVAGDMWVGALLDLGLPLRDLQDVVAALGLADRCSLSSQRVRRGSLAGTRFCVDVAAEDASRHRHLPDILETPGFLAAMRLVPIEPEREGRFINLFYLDEHPQQALAALAERVPELSARGRMESPGKAVRLLFAGPYRPLIPLQYDFL